jgi:hypothetical protein
VTKTITGSHEGLTYEPIAVPADKIRLIFPANTFSAEMIGNHVKLTISTDAAGIPSVIAKLEALQHGLRALARRLGRVAMRPYASSPLLLENNRWVT